MLSCQRTAAINFENAKLHLWWHVYLALALFNKCATHAIFWGAFLTQNQEYMKREVVSLARPLPLLAPHTHTWDKIFDIRMLKSCCLDTMKNKSCIYEEQRTNHVLRTSFYCTHEVQQPRRSTAHKQWWSAHLLARITRTSYISSPATIYKCNVRGKGCIVLLQGECLDHRGLHFAIARPQCSASVREAFRSWQLDAFTARVHRNRAIKASLRIFFNIIFWDHTHAQGEEFSIVNTRD